MSGAISRKRISVAAGSPADWLEPSLEPLSEHARQTYRRRERAVRMYAAHESFDAITEETRLSRREVYRLVERFTTPHPVHGIFGLLALVPGQRVHGYQRQKPVSYRLGLSSGYAGAMGALLERHPVARDTLYERLLGFGASQAPLFDRAPTFRALHKHWLGVLRELGVSEQEWPLCTGDQGYTSLVRYCHLLMQQEAGMAVPRRFGRAAGARMTMVGRGLPPLIRPMRAGSFASLDFSRFDAASCFSFETLEGRQLHQVLPRWYIALLVDEFTSATWSAFSTLEIEPSADSVLEAIDRAVRPQAYADGPRASNGESVPVHLHELLPSLGLPGICVLKMDNARCNRAHEVVNNIIDTLGCAINFGPIHTWARRSVIEKTFGQISASGAKRLASTYGSSPMDPRRPDAAAEAIRHRIDYRDVELLLQHCCRAHNENPTERLDGTSPVDFFFHALTQPQSGVFRCPLPKPTLQDPRLLDHYENCIVRGSLQKGVSPHVRPLRCRYTSPTLASSWELLGKIVRLQIKRYDVRQVTAIRPDTGEVIGPLNPEARCLDRAVSWRMRKLINRAGLRAAAQERTDPLPAWLASRNGRLLEAKASAAKRKKTSKDALALAQQSRLQHQPDVRSASSPATTGSDRGTEDWSADLLPENTTDPFGLGVVPGGRTPGRGMR